MTRSVYSEIMDLDVFKLKVKTVFIGAESCTGLAVLRIFEIHYCHKDAEIVSEIIT